MPEHAAPIPKTGARAAPRSAARAAQAHALPPAATLSALQAMAGDSPAVRTLQRLAQTGTAPGAVLQLQEAWYGTTQGDPEQIWLSVDTFLANYELVEEGELDPEVGFPMAERVPNEEAEDDAAPLLKPVPDRLEVIKAIAKQVMLDCVERFKTPEGRRKIAASVGPGGLAGYIEGEILESIRPYMQKSVKSMMPWGSDRKTRETLMRMTEGMIDIVYNACGMGVEAMSATAATPAVAAGGAGYKGALAASSVRRAGGTKEQAAATATVTGFAEFGQGMIPIAGGGFGIASGLKGTVDGSRIGERIKNMLAGRGGGSGSMSARPETVGDPRIFGILEARSAHLAELMAAAESCPDAGTRENRKRLTALGKAQEWLDRQDRKARERFAAQDDKGNVPLLSRTDDAGAAAAGSSDDFGAPEKDFD